jgi:hypothetical protein
MPQTRPAVAVFGSSTVRPDEGAWRLAYELGGELARAGADVMSGGYGGAMEAVSRGADEAGGHVVGVTVEVFERRGAVNPWVRERVHTRDLFERLQYLMGRASGFVVLPGSVGTLTELFLAWTLVGIREKPGAPIVLLGDPWEDFLRAARHPELVVPGLFRHVELAADAADAARRAVAPGAATVPAVAEPR